MQKAHSYYTTVCMCLCQWLLSNAQNKFTFLQLLVIPGTSNYCQLHRNTGLHQHNRRTTSEFEIKAAKISVLKFILLYLQPRSTKGG